MACEPAGVENVFAPRRKLHLLERDLAALGRAPEGIRALPHLIAQGVNADLSIREPWPDRQLT